MSLKIMVVDDEPGALKLIKAVVAPLGHEVSSFSDSTEAAERVQEQKFDVVFVDYRMPHLDGFKLTQRIRSSRLNRKTPVVMITGAYDIDVIRKASREGVAFFLTKPFQPGRITDLLTAMNRAMWREVRRFSRLPLQISVTCKWGGRSFDMECLNISEGGMLLEGLNALKAGAELYLEFNVLRDPVKPRARVIRKEAPTYIAVEFIDLTPEDRRAIQGYISGEKT